MGKDTMEIDKDDVVRLHDKIDNLSSDMTAMKVDMAEVKTKLSLVPDIKQPCKFFDEHIQQHKDSETLWKRPIVSCIVDIIKMAIVFAAAFIWGKSK